MVLDELGEGARWAAIPTLRKHLRHCELGQLELGCQTLQLPGSDLRLV
jgi:hypothetical protein